MNTFYKRWLLIILLIFVLGIGYKAVRVIVPAYSLWRDTQTLQNLADTQDFTSIDPEKLDKTAQSVHKNTRELHTQLKSFFPLFRRLDWIPVLGDDLAAAPDLLEAGLLLSESGAVLSEQIAAPILREWQADSSQELLLLVAQTVDDSRQELPTARANLWSAEYFLNNADVSGRLRDPLQRLQKRLPDARLVLDALSQLPNIIGLYGEERNYLLVLQNEDELRATGGFISAVGVARFQNGHLDSITFEDSYTLDKPDAPLLTPPAPLQEFMLAETWVLRDANWSPDAPTAARDIQKIYESNTGEKLDGVIMLNQEAVVRLVDAIGPLTLPDFPEPITGANLRNYMRRAYSPDESVPLEEWWLDRKQFIQVLFDAIMQRIQVEYSQVDMVRLMDNLRSALDEGHIILNTFTLPGVQVIIEGRGWHRPLLQAGTGDYLMVVNSNLGFNKVNAVVQHQMEYHVSLTNLENLFTRLSLSYTHPQGEGVDCIHEARYGDTLSYEEMISRCYWNYVRVYPSSGSQLIESSLHPIAGEMLLSSEGWDGRAERSQEILWDGRIVQPITQFLLVSDSETASFTYGLPQKVLSQEDGVYAYHLIIQKQDGVVSTPTVVIVDLPLNAVKIHAPFAVISENKVVRWELDLRQDTEFFIEFELE
ncbi:MAG: DUF4012 domain-containing protein [Anaerolineae bacterium]|nr:DUF4012 domain-containing protein [Anaerolineae bacterium]